MWGSLRLAALTVATTWQLLWAEKYCLINSEFTRQRRTYCKICPVIVEMPFSCSIISACSPATPEQMLHKNKMYVI